MATTPPALRNDAERSPDVLCPVQIHVHDPTIRERRRHPRSQSREAETRHRRADVDRRSDGWIDLDENVALDNYNILIDDKNLGPLISDVDSEELPYPEDAVEDDDNDDDEEEDTGSHGGRREWFMYKRLKRNASKRHRPEFDLGATYPLANSHGNAYQDSSSHSKYTELCSEERRNAGLDNLDMIRDLNMSTPYAVANSHGGHGEHGDSTTVDTRNRAYIMESSESDNLTWDARPADVNYEIANSHSNYRVFYDSQTQHRLHMLPPWSSEIRSGNHHNELRRIASENFQDNIEQKRSNDEANTNESEKKTEEEPETTTCDIEQCLVQIEESLLNIEQNLLHVQDLDLPELRNLLYKSPSIERSLYEVQDLLYMPDGIVPVIARNKSMSLDSEEGEDNEEEEEEEVDEEEVWVGRNITVKDNDDDEGANASAPPLNDSNEESSDTANITEHNPSRSADDHCTDHWLGGSSKPSSDEEKDSNLKMNPEETTINFVPNSLGKTLPRRIVLDEVGENIRLCSSQSEEPPMLTIDYNLNSACAEKKSLFRDKWYSRTNSLDENSIFQNPERGDNRGECGKPSLHPRDLFLESAGSRRLAAGAKARSEGTLQTNQKKRRSRRGSHEDKLLQAVEATAEDFRKKLESFASQRRSILNKQKKATKSKSANEVPDNAASRSREKSPVKSKRAVTTAAKTQDTGAGKNTADKRKRKKVPGKNQDASDNSALVPSKLISLSLSLLLAALLQAVRCLTDLVEDAFRSVSYDKSGLLQ